jgi:hypothetical protein
LPPAEVERVAMAAIERGLPILAAKPLGADARAARTPVDDAPITFTGWGSIGSIGFVLHCCNKSVNIPDPPPLVLSAKL